jgi:hypothetical protein
MSAFHPLRTSRGRPSFGWMASAAASNRQLWLGLTTLLALGLASLAFGFTHVGRFCVFMIFAMPVVQAMRRGMFPYVAGRHSLVRADEPSGFWTAVVLHLMFACAALWYFVEGLRS